MYCGFILHDQEQHDFATLRFKKTIILIHLYYVVTLLEQMNRKLHSIILVRYRRLHSLRPLKRTVVF